MQYMIFFLFEVNCENNVNIDIIRLYFCANVLSGDQNVVQSRGFPRNNVPFV